MPDPFEDLPDVPGTRDDWAEWEATRANPSTDNIQNAWDAFTGRLTPAQREAAMRPGSALVLARAGTGKTSTLTASVVHKIAVEKRPPSRLTEFFPEGRQIADAAIWTVLSPDRPPPRLVDRGDVPRLPVRSTAQAADLKAASRPSTKEFPS
jgi:UvrD/REP helicase N-terminal domain